MKVALLFDGISALGPTPDIAILATVEAVEAALEGDGHSVVRIPVNPDARWIERMRRGRFDLAFNLCECVDGVAALEPAVIGVLELLAVPFTGSNLATTALCLRKNLVNAMLERAGLPVPRFATVRPGGKMPRVGFPAICKPAAEDASIGIEQRSVVRTMRALEERVSAMHQRWEEILVQRYIDGREVNVGIVNGTVLPIAEIDFAGMPRGKWRIVSYRSKWETGSDEDLGSLPKCPAELPAKLTRELAAISLAAWKAVGGRGYGRCDFRIDRTGRPWLLEVNSNPDIAPDAGLARMAGVAGMSYAEMIRAIVHAAIERPEAAPTEERWSLARQLSGVDALSDEELRIQAEARVASGPR
jgi:D-alanine-D-alanine ligase